MKTGISVDSIILDLDGTLADSLPGIEFSVLRALELCGVPSLIPDIRTLVGPPIREILATISGRNEQAQLDELERAFRSVYDGGAWKQTSLYPGVIGTLGTLAARGIRLFVVTNKPAIPAERVLARLDLLPLLTALCSLDQRRPIFRTKAEAVAQLLADWSINSEHVMLVGDSRDDAHAAAHCGCRFVGVEFGYGNACSQSDFPVDFKIRHFGELLSILARNYSEIHQP